MARVKTQYSVASCTDRLERRTLELVSLIRTFLVPEDEVSLISCVLVEAPETMTQVASALGDDNVCLQYRSAAAAFDVAVNRFVWTKKTGGYLI